MRKKNDIRLAEKPPTPGCCDVIRNGRSNEMNMFWVPLASRDSDQKILNLGDCTEKTQEEIKGALRITWPRKRKG